MRKGHRSRENSPENVKLWREKRRSRHRILHTGGSWSLPFWEVVCSRFQMPRLDSVRVIWTSILVQQGLPTDHIPRTKMDNGSTFLHTLSAATSRVQGPLLSVTCPSPVIKLRSLQPWRLSGQREEKGVWHARNLSKAPQVCVFHTVAIFCLYYTGSHLTVGKAEESGGNPASGCHCVSLLVGY